MKTTRSSLKTTYSVRGIPSFQIELVHEGLHKHKVIKGSDPYLVERKASIQATAWDEIWSKRSSVNNLRAKQSEAKELAFERTREAQDVQEELKNILHHTLEIDDAIDWNLLKNYEAYQIPAPVKRRIPPLVLTPAPAQPDRNHSKYQVHLSGWEKFLSIFGVKPAKRIEAMDERFQIDTAKWKQAIEVNTKRNQERQIAHQNELNAAEKEFDENTRQWHEQKAKYLAEQELRNQDIDRQKEAYFNKDAAAVKKYCELVLSNSFYPEMFPQEFELDYQAESGVLVIEYLLPSLDDIPTLIEVKYIAARNEFTEKHLPETQKTKLYDEIIYQTALRTIHELYEADTIDAISYVVFNGYVTALNRATGHRETNCIMSLQAERNEFLAINLHDIEPKTCFRQLKGVAAAKLSSMTAIPPLVKLNKEDSRFVASYNVGDTLDEGVNLAAMGWEDFEHLIRELFEKEFASNGGEVKVTQASRDGGVDAIAFDPDPIRGGKIVIQAKRYTNTVGVSAIRDLYGTVMNEGATKGIIVTTSDYGPDAYEFARNKPLTLINGGNLLYLLQKHGHKAKINLKEAKEYFNTTQKS